MKRVVIADAVLRRWVQAQLPETAREWVKIEEIGAEGADIVVVRSTDPLPLQGGRCGILLLPAGSAPKMRSRSVVSYGNTGKDTLAVSGIEQEKILISLERELVTVWGKRVERQEIFAKRDLETEGMLAGVGVLILLGLSE
ncbi:MAG: hypothetical protein RR053_00235 [Evtepia sp.]